MSHRLLSLLLLSACSNGMNGLGPIGQKEPPDLTPGTGTGNPTTDPTTTPGPTGPTGPTGPGPTGPGACDPSNAPGAGIVAVLPDCEYTPSGAGTTFLPTVEWAMTSAMTDVTTGVAFPTTTWAEYDGYGSVYHAPVVRQVTDDNGDGAVDGEDTPDIAAIMAHPDDRLDAVLRLISGDGSGVHDSVSWLSFTNAQGAGDYAPYHYAGLAIADLDGDGNVEIATLVTRQSDGLCYPAYYQVNRSGSGATITLEQVWGGTDYNCGGHAPAIADLDDDGELEVIYGRAVFRADMTQKWYGTGGRAWYGRADYPYPEGYWNSGYHPFAYDMDGDGSQMEVVAGRTVYTSTGGTFCELGEYQGTTWVGAIDGYPAVADMLRFVGDIEGEPEIVVTGNEFVSVYHGVPDYDPNGLARCTLVARLPNDPADDPAVNTRMPTHPNCNVDSKSFGGPPTVADFDGDGDREVAVAGACWYSVYRFEAGGFERYAMAQTKDWSSASTGSTVFDFNGDGASEIVFSDEDAVYVWGLDDSAGLDPWDRLDPYLVDTQHKSWTIHEYPLVADVDRDGKAEIVVSNSHLPGYLDKFGIYVLGSLDDDWVSARPVWNQHAYHVTNVEDDGDVGYAEPNYYPYLAEDLNSFRTQSPGAFGATAAPNVTAAITGCQESCGDLTVWIQVANDGSYIAVGPDTPIALYGVDSTGRRTMVADTTVGTRLGGGELSDSYEFVLTAGQWSPYVSLVAVADDTTISGVPLGRANECDETDNEASLALSSYCP